MNELRVLSNPIGSSLVLYLARHKEVSPQTPSKGP